MTTRRYYLLATLTALAMPVAASARAVSSTPPEPAACESCTELYEQSHVLLESCQSLTGNEQIVCLDNYNRAAERYEGCMLRKSESEGSAPMCVPAQPPEPHAPPPGPGKGGGKGSGKSGTTGDTGEKTGSGGGSGEDMGPERLPGGVVAPVQLPPQDQGGGTSGSPDAPDGQSAGGAASGGSASDGSGPNGSEADGTGAQGPIVEGGPGQVIDMGSSSKPCPEALAPIAATGAILSAPYLTRVGMPLYLPQAYGQIGGIQPALPAGKLGWVVAQALEETSLSAHNNVLNIQPNAAEIAELKGLGLVLSVTTFKSPEYLADKDEGVRSPGMEPQNAITGKWLHRVTNTRPLFRDYVAAVSGYLWFMERRYPKVYKVLMDPASTLDDFALSLAGYGTSPRYSDTKKLKGRLKEHLKAQAAYLAQRIKIMEASPCGAETGSEVGTLRAIQTDAARDGQP